MISSSHRFHGHNSLRAVYQHGKSVRNPFILLRYRATARPAGYRAAVVVSRKVHKSAVVRNRIRRRVYAVLKDTQSRFRGPHDLVFVAFSERLADVSAEELRKLVLGHLEKAGVLRPQNPPPHAIVHKEKKEF